MNEVQNKIKKSTRMILRLSPPLILQSIASFSMIITDNLTVGSLGEASISAAASANGIQLLLQFFLVGCEGAIVALVSKKTGAKKFDDAKKIANFGLLFAFSLALIISIVSLVFTNSVLKFFIRKGEVVDEGISFLKIISLSFPVFAINQCILARKKGEGKAKFALFVSVLALTFKIILNVILIFGFFGVPKLGLFGAGLSTLISRSIEFIVILLYIFIKNIKSRERKSFKSALPSKSSAITFIKYGAPLILGQIIWAFNNLFTTAIMGRVGIDALSAYGISSSLNNLVFTFVGGASCAVSIVISRLVGEGEDELVYSVSKKICSAFISIGLVTGAMIFFLANPYFLLFNISEKAYALSRIMVGALTILSPFTAYQSASLMGLIKSGGGTFFVFLVEAASVFLVIIPLTLFSYRLGFSLPIIFISAKLDQILKCIIAQRKLKSSKWIVAKR